MSYHALDHVILLIQEIIHHCCLAFLLLECIINETKVKMESFFSRSMSGPPFEGNEEKKFEFCRYGSFKDWPCECPVYPSRLASAGFFATGNGDEVVCYVCGARKAGWKDGDDPGAIHRQLSGDCQFFSENFEGNVPISASEVIGNEISNDQRLSDLQRLLESTSLGESLNAEEGVNRNNATDNEENLDENSNRICSLENTNVANAGVVTTGSETVVTENDRSSPSVQNSVNPISSQSEDQSSMTRSKSSDSVSSNTSRSSIATASNVSDSARIHSQVSAGSRNMGSKKNQGMDIPPPTGAAIGPLRFERNRLATFKKWPSGAKVSAADLAKCGFSYTGSGDRVQCVFCKGILRNWEEGDRPHIEHRKHFPRCALVLGIDSGNVPLPPGQTPRQYTSTQGGSRPVLNVAEGGINMQSLGVTTDRPKHSQFAIEAQRVASFHNWPAYKHQTPQQLAEAGFFYAGMVHIYYYSSR